MSQPKWSAAWLPTWKLSHAELMNQVLKAPISSSPPSSLRTKSQSLSKSCEEFECTSIELQDLFNMLDLVGQARIHNYTPYQLSWKPSSPALEQKLGEPSVTVLLRFVSVDTLVAFDVHAYLSYDVRILAKDLLDPKAIFLIKRVKFLLLPPNPTP